MNKVLFVPGELFGDAEAMFLDAGIEIAYAGPEGVRADQLARAHALSALKPGGHHLRVDAELLDAAPNLEVVFVPAAGTDAIDLAACTERGIAVLNAAGNNYPAVAEHTVGLILALSRMIALTDRAVHREKRAVRTLDIADRMPGLLSGKTLGLLGFGFIGREVARICRDGFGMRVIAYDPFFSPVEAERLGVRVVDDLGPLLAESDVVSVHSPLTPETSNLIGAPELAAMKPTAFLVNTSRGGTVDTDAVVAALREGRLGGAGLDVTEPEPLPDGHPLFGLDNVVLTSHVAGASPETVARAGRMSAEDVLRAFRGARPRNLINPDVWPAFAARLAHEAAVAS